jgi:AcrR family transcriptional regulator
MPPSGELTRQRILTAAYRCFYREGFQRVSVDTIAAEANVTKKTLYYHFASKDELVGAVLQAQSDHALALIETALASDQADPALAVREILENLGRWAKRPRWYGSGFTRLALELADQPGHPARVAAREHKRIVQETLARRLEERGISQSALLARQISILIEGATVLMLIRGDREFAANAADAAEVLTRHASEGDRATRPAGRKTRSKPAD